MSRGSAKLSHRQRLSQKGPEVRPLSVVFAQQIRQSNILPECGARSGVLMEKGGIANGPRLDGTGKDANAVSNVARLDIRAAHAI